MLSKAVSSTIFWVFGMSKPGIESRSPGPLANTLLIWPNHWIVWNMKTSCPLRFLSMIEIDLFKKLLSLDQNTWNHIDVCGLLVLAIYRNSQGNKYLCWTLYFNHRNFLWNGDFYKNAHPYIWLIYKRKHGYDHKPLLQEEANRFTSRLVNIILI